MTTSHLSPNGSISAPKLANRPVPRFDEFASDYDAGLQQGLSATGESKDYFALGRIHYLQARLNRLAVKPTHILDFGCGTGTSMPLLLGLPGAQTVAGVDVSEESLKRAARTYGAGEQMTIATVEQLAPAGNMDLAFCNGVFHHIRPADRADSMRYIFDSLRPGGLFAFWENNPWNPGTRYVMSRIPFDHDAITLSPPEAARLTEAAGFEVVFTRFIFFFPKLLNWMRRLEPVMDRIPLGGQYIVLCRKPDR
jgi:SAM-dependent methyltransferase